MGRKAKEKERHDDKHRAHAWVSLLIPGLQGQELGKLRIDDFAKIMGKSKSTVYQYFRSKEEVIEYAIDLRLEEISGYEQAFDPKQDPQENYQHILEYLIKGLEGITSGFMHDLKIHYPQAWEKVQRVLDAVIDLFRGFYSFYMEKGLLKTVSLDLLTAMDRWFAFEHLLSEHTMGDLGTVLEEYIHIRFEGIFLAQKKGA